MLKAVGLDTETNEPLFFFVLDRENIIRLVAGKPITVKLSEMDQAQRAKIVISYTENLQTAIDALKRHSPNAAERKYDDSKEQG